VFQDHAGGRIRHGDVGVGRTFLVLGSGEAVARLVAFAATVYLARTLGATSYGIVGLALAVRLYFLCLVEGGIDSIGAREVAADPTRAAVLAPPLLAVRLAVAIGLVSVLGLVALLLLPQPDGVIIAGYALTLLPVALNTRWVAVGLGWSRAAVAGRIGGEAMMAIVVLLTVRGVHDLAKAPLAQLLGDGFAALVLASWLAREGMALTVHRDWTAARPVLRSALPLVGHAILGLVIFNSDFLFLRAYYNPTQLGYYAAAYTLVSFLLNLGVTYYQSLLPSLTRVSASVEARTGLYHTAMAQVFAAGFPLAVGGGLLAPLIIQLVFGDVYGPSTVALRILLLSIPAAFLRNVAQAALVAIGAQAAVFRTSVIAAACCLALNLALIPRYGILGAALATFLTETLRTIVVLGFARKAGFASAGLPRFWPALLAGVAMGAVLWVVRPGTLWTGLSIGVLAYGGVLTLGGGLRFRKGRLPVLSV
jgi:O-antigen/teichoic acid export membrane protein